jgi:ectoine hydroxylase-related dioxygenase (phytanoyl-CoA dioxygenase family)
MTAVDLDTTIAANPAETSTSRSAPYRVSVDEYMTFRRQGFLVVNGLVSQGEIAELRAHIDDLTLGRLPEQSGHLLRNGDHSSGVATQELAAPPEDLSPDQKAEYFLRIHMLHRQLELHERYLLHPGILDVLQALTGPDILALQTMLFVKGPGKPGQGWHQDSYYIPTHPDSLCGAWIAIDDCDELNGAMWFASGSQHEPVYPPDSGYGHGDRNLEGLSGVSGVSNPNDDENDLSKIANRYPHLLVSAGAGDVVFFAGHVLHRSKTNWTTDRFRRSFVGHYCNARSFTQWNDGDGSDLDQQTMMANKRHILARGDTHLPFATPRFGTPCAALLPPEDRRRESEFAAMMMGDMESGMMGAMDADPTLADDD